MLNDNSTFKRLLAGLGAGLGAGLAAGVGAAQAQIALPEIVETQPIAVDPFSMGLLDRADGALPATLWDGAEPQTIDYLLERLPAQPAAPSLGEAMRRVLLSSGGAPQGAGPSLGGKKLLALARAGFIEEARTVASLSSAERNDPWTGQALAVADMLEGDAATACRRGASLSSGRGEPFWVKLRVLCYAQAGELDAADLTLNILREQGLLASDEDAFLFAAARSVAPDAPLAPRTALQYAIARTIEAPVAPGLLARADGGVLAAIAADDAFDDATRIDALQRAVAMGVADGAGLSGLLRGVEFDLADIGNAAALAGERPGNPLTDALLYQSVQEMNAPEFIRDKAQRIALALRLADSFHRAYALSLLYADDIAALEGVVVAPSEARRFAAARMAAGDSVGAAQWLSAALDGAGVAALPEPEALAFIDQVNLLALLDPQTASQVARAAGVSLLQPAQVAGAEPPLHDGAEDRASMARVLETAFDAAVDDIAGQAALAALAASAADGSDDVRRVVISRSLSVAGMGELDRRYAFERAWAATFNAPPQLPRPEERGFGPRLKPNAG